MRYHRFRLFTLLTLSAFVVLSLTGSTRAQCPPDDMVSYWKLDEISSDTYIDHYGGNDGGCAGACPTPATGAINGAQEFDGTSTGIDVPDDASLDWMNTESFSIEVWINTTQDGSGNKVFIGRSKGGSDMVWWLGYGSDNKAILSVEDSDNNNFEVQGTSIINNGSWHHIVGVRDSDTHEIQIYVDGIQENATSTSYTGDFSGTNPLNIGYLAAANHFDGLLDEIAIYRGTLSDEEISQHYYDGYVGLRWGYCPCAFKVNIMPLGDSITDGEGSDGANLDTKYLVGYRQRLYLDLEDRGYEVNFVGSLQSGQLAEPGFDYDHEGNQGYSAGEVADYVYDWLGAHPADVVLLHVGTCSLTTSPDDVEAVLDEIDRYSEDVTVVLARIINRKTYSPDTTEFNINLAAMAEARIANGDKIVIVDQENALTYPDDMWDNLHPNLTGYNKMADVWLDALDDFLPVCDWTAPVITSTPVTAATVAVLYTYDVNTVHCPPATYGLETYPPGMTIDPETGVISWIPDETGDFDVGVVATNLEGTDYQDFTITVGECPNDMISYWKLDETGSPSTFEDFYGNNDGSCSGADCPTPVTGIVEGALNFDGSDEIDVPDDDSLNWTNSESFSIEAWINTTQDGSGNKVFMGKCKGGSDMRWWLGNGSDNNAIFSVRDSDNNGFRVQGTSIINNGSWHHIVGVRDSDTHEIQIYVDGAKENTTSTSYTGDFSGTNPLNIGYFIDANHFYGLLDEIAVYDRALTLAEIQHHHTGGLIGLGYCESGEFAPTIISDPVIYATLGQVYTYDVNAAGNPVPTYALNTLRSGMEIDLDTGIMSWTPDEAGDFDVEVVASNTEGKDFQDFTITVRESPAESQKADNDDGGGGGCFIATAGFGLPQVGINMSYSALHFSPTITVIMLVLFVGIWRRP